MMPRPVTHSNRQICDGLRSYATPRGRLSSRFRRWSGYPSIAAPLDQSRVDVMCQERERNTLVGGGWIGALSYFTFGLRPARRVVVAQELLQSLDVRRARTLAPDENGLSPGLASRQCVDRQSVALGKRAQDAARQQCHAQARDDAAQQGRIRAKLDHALRHRATLRAPILQPLAMRAAVLEGDDRTWDHALLTDRWMIGSRHDDPLV